MRLRPCLLASAIIHLGGLPETQSERAAPSSLLDLAPGGGCLAVHITVSAGGLLRRLFTMTGFVSPARSPFPSNPARPRCPAVVFCGPVRQISPSRDFPGVVPCGVRTFLDSPKRGNRDRLTGLRPLDNTLWTRSRQLGPLMCQEVFLRMQMHDSWSSRVGIGSQIHGSEHPKRGFPVFLM